MMILLIVGAIAGGRGVVLWGVGEKCFPVFLETGLSLIFCDLGFCCCAVWGCRAAGFVFCALTNRGLCWFKCQLLAHGWIASLRYITELSFVFLFLFVWVCCVIVLVFMCRVHVPRVRTWLMV